MYGTTDVIQAVSFVLDNGARMGLSAPLLIYVRVCLFGGLYMCVCVYSEQDKRQSYSNGSLRLFSTLLLL